MGSYTVARWKELNGSTCKEGSAPYKAGAVRVKATQAEAEAEFDDTYFSTLGSYTLQQ